MLSIGKFFERIQNVRMKGYILRKVVQESMKNHVGLEVPMEAISIHSSAVILKNVSQSLRSAIFIKKGSVLKEINEKQTVREITDIR